MHRNALRLLTLVNTLLDFSRIEAGRTQASFEPTDLAAFTQDLASVFRSAIGARRPDACSSTCPPLDEPVYVDREMWEKIVLNLALERVQVHVRRRDRGQSLPRRRP